MKARSLMSFVILIFFSLYSASCTMTKFVNPKDPPPKIKSKNIKIFTKDNREFYFTEVRLENDTLYGVSNRSFPADIHAPEVQAIPTSSIGSISYVAPDRLGTAIVIGVTALTLIAIAVAVSAPDFGDMGNW